MQNHFITASAIFVGVFLTTAANAQLLSSDIITTPQAGQTYVSLGGVVDGSSTTCLLATGYCVNARGINISTIARAADVNGQFSAINGQLGGLNSQVSGVGNQLSGINNQLNSFSGLLGTTNAQLNGFSGLLGTTSAQLTSLASQFNGFSAMQTGTNEKLFDLIAVSAALKDAVPNAGDRFAVRVNLGGFQNNLAGGISGTARLNESVRFSAGFGHGNRQSLFNAGMNFSFN